MSDTTKRPYTQVYAIAEQLKQRLAPACHRIELAGSLRRQRPLVGDIEIVAIPIIELDLFGQPTGPSHVDILLSGWPVEFIKDGPKYKQFIFTTKRDECYQVDLFLQSPDTWGINYMIRTGSQSFSRQMVTQKSKGGLMPSDLKVSGGRVWRGAEALDTPEETDVFGLWGMEFVAPGERD